MGEVIAAIVFIAWMTFVIGWAHRVIVEYLFTEEGLRIQYFGITRLKIPYEEIESCEVVQAGKLWRISVLLGPYHWCRTRWFADGVLIRAYWKNCILTPKDPEEFCRLVAEHRQRKNKSLK